MLAVKKLAYKTDVKTACLALGVPRATYYRQQAAANKCLAKKPMRKHLLALSELEQQAVLNQLSSERFVDKSPGEV